MSVVDYQTTRTRRLDAQSMQRLLARAGLASIVAGPVLSLAVVGFWFDSRLTKFEQNAASNSVVAVVDGNGNQYGFTAVRAADWQPDDALYFDKLESIIDCVRGLRMPQDRGGKSCWLKVYPVLSDAAKSKLNADLSKQFGESMAGWPAGFAKHPMEVEILPGSTKADDGRYRLQWREKDLSNGREEYWSGTFAVSRVIATAAEVAAGNAIGLRIESFTWQRDQVVGKK